MNRGTVMEKSGDNAVVLTPDGQFVRISIRRDAAIGDDIWWTDSQTVPYRRRFQLPGRRWMSSAGAAAAVLLLMFGLWSFRAPTVVAYVSMDVNPSVEFGLDSQERVRELRAINGDAQPYIEDMVYKGKPIEAVMEILARKLTESHILNAADSEVVIASVRVKSVDAKWEREVTAKIERVLVQVSAGDRSNASTGASLDIEKLYLPVEIREEAQANGISSGKMAFWLAAENKGHAVPLSSLQQQSLKKIAASWGGVDEVLHDTDDHKTNQETWKKLLADQKHKKNKHNKDEVNFVPSASASPFPATSATSGQEEQEGGEPEQSDDLPGKNDSKDPTKPEHDKQKQEDKKKQIEEKRKKLEEEKKTQEEDRGRPKNGKNREKQQEREKSEHRQKDRSNHKDDKTDDHGDHGNDEHND